MDAPGYYRIVFGYIDLNCQLKLCGLEQKDIIQLNYFREGKVPVHLFLEIKLNIQDSCRLFKYDFVIVYYSVIFVILLKKRNIIDCWLFLSVTRIFLKNFTKTIQRKEFNQHCVLGVTCEGSLDIYK